MASENIPLQIMKDVSSQTQSNKYTTPSNSDIPTTDSKPAVKKDTGLPPTMVDNQHKENGEGVIDNGKKMHDQPLGVSKEGHGDMPEIKSTTLPELVANNSGDVLKTTALKSSSEMHKTTAPESIADARGTIQKTLAPESSSVADDHGDKMKTTPTKSSSEAGDSDDKTEALESKSELISDVHDDVQKTLVPESSSVADDHGDKSTSSKSSSETEDLGEAPNTTALESKSESISDYNDDVPKTTAHESNSKEVAEDDTVADDHGGKTTASKSISEAEDPAKVPKTEALESRSESISDDHSVPKTTAESNLEKVADDDTLKTESVENKADTDSIPYDLELDLVLDDQVMSFVNLAISNATRSICFQDNAEQDPTDATIRPTTDDIKNTELPASERDEESGKTYQDNVEQDSTDATIRPTTGGIKNTELPSERDEESGKTYHDEKQSIDDDIEVCQFKENETQLQSSISSSQMDKSGNMPTVNAQDTTVLKDAETVKDPTTLPEDLTIAGSVQGEQEGAIDEDTTAGLQIDTKFVKDGIDLTKVPCKESVEPELEKNKESASHSQNDKRDYPETIARSIQHTSPSKDKDSQSQFLDGKSNDQEDLTRCVTENIGQDEPLLAAGRKEDCLLRKTEGHQNDNNDTKTQFPSVDDEGDLHKEENVENKQDEINAITKATGRPSQCNKDNSQKQQSVIIKDQLVIMKRNNESDNEYKMNECCLQEKYNADNTQDELSKTNEKKDEQTNDSRNEEVGIPVKKVNGVTDVRVTSADEKSEKKLSEDLLKPEPRQEDSGLALVNDRLRTRIAELQSQIKEISCQLAFVGDRNWRLEAYMECLIHTLEKMSVTDIEDLDQTTLSLELFKVKVKAGYRLGPYNGLPQRARRSYKRDGITPPTIDLSGGSLACRSTKDGKSKLPFNISETDDIGLSVKQMRQYEDQIETLTMKNHFLETQLQHLRNANPNIGALQPQESQPIPQGICQPAPPGMEYFGGIPTVPYVPPQQIMQPMVPQIDHVNTNVESFMAESMTDTQHQQPPKPHFSSPLRPTEPGRSTKAPPYVPPPRFQNKRNTGSPSSGPNVGRQNIGGSGRYRNDGWYGHGRSGTEMSSYGPSWRRTEQTNQSPAWRKPSYSNC